MRWSRVSNTLGPAVATAIIPIALFLSYPYLIDRLGRQDFALFILVNTTFSVLMIFNFGIGESTIRLIAAASTDEKRRRQAVSWALSFSSKFTVILAVFLALATFSWADWIGLPPNISLYFALFLVVVFALRFLLQQLLSCIKGLGRYDFAALFLLLDRTFLLMAALTTATLAATIEELFFSYAVMAAGLLLVGLWVLRRMAGQSDRGSGYVPPWGEFGRFAGWAAAVAVLGVLNQNVDKYFVVAKVSMEALAVYAVAFSLVAQVHSVCASASNWLFTELTVQFSKNGRISLSRVWLLAYVTIPVALGGAVYLSAPLIKVWLGSDLFQDFNTLLGATSVLVMVTLYTIIPYILLNSAGMPKYNAIAGAAEIIVFILLLLLADIASMNDVLIAKIIGKSSGLAYSVAVLIYSRLVAV